MIRPTKVEVEVALRIAGRPEADIAMKVLAAELHAVGLELAAARRNYDVASSAHEAAELRIVELRKELAQAWTEGTLAADKSMGERIRALEGACAEHSRGEAQACATVARVEALLAQTEEYGNKYVDVVLFRQAVRGEP